MYYISCWIIYALGKQNEHNTTINNENNTGNIYNSQSNIRAMGYAGTIGLHFSSTSSCISLSLLYYSSSHDKLKINFLWPTVCSNLADLQFLCLVPSWFLSTELTTTSFEWPISFSYFIFQMIEDIFSQLSVLLRWIHKLLSHKYD